VSETYTPSDTTPQVGGVTMVEDGDALDAASVRVGMEEMADAIETLQALVNPGDSDAGSIILTRMVGFPCPGTNAEIDGAESPDGFPSPCVVAGDGIGPTSDYAFAYLLELPHDCELQSIRAYVYEDTGDTTTVTMEVVRRDYAITVDPGDPANVPQETVLGTTAAKVAVSGGISYAQATVSSHVVDRESASDYFVRVSGTVTGSNVRWLPRVVASLAINRIDQAAG
jgi:hypothetical protein